MASMDGEIPAIFFLITSFELFLISSKLKKFKTLSPMLIPSISKSLISSALVQDWRLKIKSKTVKNILINNTFSPSHMCVNISGKLKLVSYNLKTDYRARDYESRAFTFLYVFVPQNVKKIIKILTQWVICVSGIFQF